MDDKRELLRHLIATIGYRGGLAISNAPSDFPGFRVQEATRSPGELLAHICDLLEGSLYLLRGELKYLTTSPQAWDGEVSRFFDAVKELDVYLASEQPLACPVEKLVQGPVCDALTHVGQIVMLRRFAGSPIKSGGYFAAKIVPGEVGHETFINPSE
jgi:hypothetical protein